MQNTELKLIEIIKNSLSDSSYLGDDCAYLKDFGLCVSTDSLVEDVHFSFLTTSATLLARKALKVNISDILASGAKPKYATVCLSGKLDEKFIEEFYFSLNACANEFGVKIVGGDLCRADKLTVSICVLGDIRGVNISSRKNAKNGYILALCGEFGTSAKGLENLEHDFCAKDYFSKIHLDPILYPQTAFEISHKALEPYAMMDSSDGLVNALEWFAKSSNIGFDIQYDLIPKMSGVTREQVLFGGEDYCLVCALSKADYKRVNLPQLVCVGYASSQAGIRLDDIDIKNENREEFLHFD